MPDYVIYSAICGPVDDPERLMLCGQPPKANLQCVLFTDQLPKGQYTRQGLLWLVRPLYWRHFNPRRSARFHKLNPTIILPKHDVSIWIDGAMRIKPGVDLTELPQSLDFSSGILTFKHPDRTCIYQELEACLRLRKDYPETMKKQIERYRSEGYPPYHGLVETSLLIREDKPSVRKFNSAWWAEIEAGSLRDQLSFNYTAWKLQQPYGLIPGSRDRSQFLEFAKHLAAN